MTTKHERRRSMRSVSPRKEARRPVEDPPSPTPPAETAGETPRETTDPRSKAGGKLPAQNSHRKAMRSVSPRKEARKSTDKGSNPPPPAGTARPPPEAEEPEVELRRPSMLSKLKGVMKPSKGKAATGADNRSSAAPSAGPAVRPKDNPRPTSLPVTKTTSRPPKHAGHKLSLIHISEPTRPY